MQLQMEYLYRLLIFEGGADTNFMGKVSIWNHIVYKMSSHLIYFGKHLKN